MDDKYTINIKDPLQENFEEAENIDKQIPEITFSEKQFNYLQNFIKSNINKQNHQKITQKDLEQEKMKIEKEKMKNKLFWIKYRKIILPIILIIILLLPCFSFYLSVESETHKQTFEGIFTVIKWIYTCFFSAVIGGLADRFIFNKSNN